MRSCICPQSVFLLNALLYIMCVSPCQCKKTYCFILIGTWQPPVPWTTIFCQLPVNWYLDYFQFFVLLQAITDVLPYIPSPCTHIFVWKGTAVSKDLQSVSFNDVARWREKQRRCVLIWGRECNGLEVVMRSKENADLRFCTSAEEAASIWEDRRSRRVLWGDLILSSGGRRKECSGKSSSM